MTTKPRPGIYIPTLYFAEGLPYALVMMMSGIFFKDLGASNVFIGLTSFLYLPWILKFAWAPLVDYYASKRTWIVVAQVVLVAAFAGSALAAASPWPIALGLGCLAFTALASATQDIAIDGYYLDLLDQTQQAFFVGVRNVAYKCAWLFASGALVILAGALKPQVGTGGGWAAAFLAAALLMAASALLHARYLPRAVPTAAGAGPVPGAPAPDFARGILGYFRQPGIAAIVAYILLFRLGDALMLKQAPNFLLDPSDHGGLGLSVADVGMVNGSVGVICLLAGGVVGSYLVSRGGLRRWLWPAALIQNSAILLYWALALFQPQLSAAVRSAPVFCAGVHAFAALAPIYLVNALEQFAYGLGVSAYTVFLMTTVGRDYKAAHYATATALMALGVMLPGAASGKLWEWLGYPGFFALSFLASIPGIVAIFYLPIWRKQDGS